MTKSNTEERTNEELADHLCDGSQSAYNGILETLQAKDKEAEEMMREVMALANEMHTTLKIGDTDGSEFNKGYVLYQDMVLDILKETETIAQKYGINLTK